MQPSPLKFFVASFLGLIAIIAVYNYGLNVKAMIQLLQAFTDPGSFEQDFFQITKGMLSMAIAPMSWQQENLNNSDWFMLTAIKVKQNNDLVFALAILEIALVNFIKPLRTLPKIRWPMTIGFAIIALTTVAINVLSASFGGF